MSASRRPTVIKLGGSLAASRRLANILKIVGAARVSCVVVPGGGPFADAVRAAQAEQGFSDVVAHRMALLAMHQMGMMLAALHARLVPAETLAQIRRALAESRIPVWLPQKLAEADPTIATDWSVTSDALAARLAERLGRAPVVLVKSCRVRSASAADLAAEGVVDAVFPSIVARGKLPWHVLGKGGERKLAALLGSRHGAA